MRTYYVTEGRPVCARPSDHYDCACIGRQRPIVLTRRPPWPQSNQYVQVRASTRAEAAALAVTAPAVVCYSGGAPRRIAGERHGGGSESVRTDLLDCADSDVLG